MRRTTVMLPSKLKAKASRLAKESGLSLGELIRSSLELRCAKNDSIIDPFFADKDYYTGSAPHALAENHDDYLYKVEG